ncbi:copper uptake system-associated protein [Stenotrophomonas lactitubi]|uniref:copper uptake system-associated protein n=1 Tax=Stenotrophomonas lactitubi TaxID=2045214 RepID=UPI00320B1DB4
MKMVVCTLLIALGLLVGDAARAAPATDASQIQTLMKGIWERPGSRLDIDPITVQETHAVAGWTQGAHGGRALLRRVQGKWEVVLCSGDALLEEKFLQEAGVTAPDAKLLATRTKVAESRLPKARVGQFSRFQGIVRMKP